MQPRDIPTVSALEKLVFKDPWPQSAYVQELYFNPVARYFVLEVEGEAMTRRPWRARRLNRIQGFVGMRVEGKRGHISTLGLHPDWRGRGLGELLLLHALEQVVDMQGTWVTLEVRASNEIAQRLYFKYGFVVATTLRGYYRDGEDALLLELDPLDEKRRRMIRERRQMVETRILHSTFENGSP
jgi:ribosomal-protein-alanine N-acetyltransferase